MLRRPDPAQGNDYEKDRDESGDCNPDTVPDGFPSAHVSRYTPDVVLFLLE